MKCFKVILFQRKLEKLMKAENLKVQEYCTKRDWDNAKKWLHINKSSFKAFRRLQKIRKDE